MLRLERVLIVLQPVLFGAAVVFSRFVEFPAPPGSLLRPMLVALLFSSICLLIAFVVTRRTTWAALIASLVVLFTLREMVPAGVLAAMMLWWVLIWAIRKAAGRAPLPGRIPLLLARTGGYFSAALLVVMATSAWGAATSRPEMHIPEYESAGSGGPNIYFLLLDGYPRADTLQATFDYSNAPFLAGLEDLGFSISEDARTNYRKTWLTLASMLNGAYIDDLLGDQSTSVDTTTELRWLHVLINEASLLDLLRDRGYAIRTIPGPFTTAALTSADDYLDNGQLNEFEARLIWSSPWALVFREEVRALLSGNQESLVAGALDTAAALAESVDGDPQFVLAHVHAPHTPFTLHPSGTSAPDLPRCFPVKCTLWHSTIEGMQIGFDEYRDGLVRQVAVLDEMVLAAIRRIVAADPDAAVIVMSDHGSRYSLADPSEQFHSLLAARAPGAGDLFADDESPVNLLRVLFSTYFDVDLEPLPYRAWLGDWGAYLDLDPFEPDPEPITR